jgi:O-antigen/teichoic acid export membrane protein
MWRIASNLLRLAGTFFIGLILVRILLQLGSEAYAVIVLVTAGLGVGGVLREIVGTSVVPLLSTAYHRDEATFVLTYNSALPLCLMASILTALFFCGLSFLLAFARIPEHLLLPARCFLLCKGTEACMSVLLAPLFEMYIVTERSGAYNFWVFVDRAVDCVAALSAISLCSPVRSDQAIIVYGALSSALCIGNLFISVAVMLMLDRRLFPRPASANRESTQKLLRASLANSTIVLANSLYFRADALIMNLSFGLFGNLVFGIATQFAAYAWVLSMGLVKGVDAVAARIYAHSGANGVCKLVRTATRMQASIAFPTCLMMAILAPVAMELWIGDRISDREAALPPIVLTVRLLCVGIIARSMGEPLLFILSGIRRVGLLAKIMFVAACLNPLLVILLANVLPQSYAYTAPALVYSFLYVAVCFVAIPCIVTLVLNLPAKDIVLAASRPLAASLLCTPLLLMAPPSGFTPLFGLMFSSATYLTAYAGLSALLTLDQGERAAIVSGILRKVRRDSPRGEF